MHPQNKHGHFKKNTKCSPNISKTTKFQGLLSGYLPALRVFGCNKCGPLLKFLIITFTTRAENPKATTHRRKGAHETWNEAPLTKVGYMCYILTSCYSLESIFICIYYKHTYIYILVYTCLETNKYSWDHNKTRFFPHKWQSSACMITHERILPYLTWLAPIKHSPSSNLFPPSQNFYPTKWYSSIVQNYWTPLKWLIHLIHFYDHLLPIPFFIPR